MVDFLNVERRLGTDPPPSPPLPFPVVCSIDPIISPLTLLLFPFGQYYQLDHVDFFSFMYELSCFYRKIGSSFKLQVDGLRQMSSFLNWGR